MRIGFYTLGCKVNQYETQAMEQLLQSAGHTVAPFSETCDGYIINTCSVTAVADKKCRAVIRRCRREHPSAVIGVCGCYSQHDPAAAESLGADVVGGSSRREDFLDAFLSCARTLEATRVLDEALKRRDFEILPPGGLEGRTRAMLKVQDGCRNFCSYCIIPYTRGPIRSAPIDLAVAQTNLLKAAGFREIVITGIEIASWGADLPDKPSLATLLEAVSEAAGSMRLRLGSLEPRIITEDFCIRLQKLPNLCPQFHLSLQSGSDGVLKRMRRKYDTARFLESITLLNRFFPDCAITTDLIVGFPGETEEEFSETLSFIRKCRFADMHIFPYSRRPGTPADKMPGQHPNAVKEDRSRRAIAVAKEMTHSYQRIFLEKELQVLFEEPEGDYFTGYTPNYLKVYMTGSDLHNQLCTVRAVSLHADGLLCVPISTP